METSMGAGQVAELRRLREQAWRGEAELYRRVQEQAQTSQPQSNDTTRHFDIEQWEEWFANEEKWLSQQVDSSVQA